MITRSISEGFKFAFSGKRILPYFVTYSVASFIIVDFFRKILDLVTTRGNFSDLFISLGISIPVFIIIGLIQLWIKGAIIDQARFHPKKRSLTKSFKYSASRYPTMFCALILYGIIVFIVSLPRYIGSLFVFLVNLILFLLYPVIIVDKKKCLDSFKRSFRVFLRYPLEVFVTWLIVVAIYFVITIIFALPMFFYFLGSITPVETKMYENVTNEEVLIKTIIPGISTSLSSPYFIPYFLVFSLAMAFNSVFYQGVQTRLYINSRKVEI